MPRFENYNLMQFFVLDVLSGEVARTIAKAAILLIRLMRSNQRLGRSQSLSQRGFWDY